MSQREVFIKRLDQEMSGICRGFHFQSMTKSYCVNTMEHDLKVCWWTHTFLLEEIQVHLDGQKASLQYESIFLDVA